VANASLQTQTGREGIFHDGICAGPFRKYGHPGNAMDKSVSSLCNSVEQSMIDVGSLVERRETIKAKDKV
jgi:hypothetical protein